MSSVRMCDKCKRIFSELEDGWQVFQATTVQYDENDNPHQVHISMDACPDCAVQTPRRKKKESESEALQRRIRELERATGIDANTEPSPVETEGTIAE